MCSLKSPSPKQESSKCPIDKKISPEKSINWLKFTQKNPYTISIKLDNFKQKHQLFGPEKTTLSSRSSASLPLVSAVLMSLASCEFTVHDTEETRKPVPTRLLWCCDDMNHRRWYDTGVQRRHSSHQTQVWWEHVDSVDVCLIDALMYQDAGSRPRKIHVFTHLVQEVINQLTTLDPGGSTEFDCRSPDLLEGSAARSVIQLTQLPLSFKKKGLMISNFKNLSWYYISFTHILLNFKAEFQATHFSASLE